MNLPRTLQVALGFGLFLGVVSANGCRSDFTSECPAGQEDCPCVGGSGGSCLEGLSCVSNTCVDLSNVDTSDTSDTQQSGEESASGEASSTSGDGDDDGDATTGDGDGDSTTGDGDGDSTTGDGDGDSTTGDGDGDGDGDSCAGGEVCMPAAPAGWEGPVIVRTAAGAAPSCPAQFPIASTDGQAMDNFTPGNWTCGCECGAVSGATCPGNGSVRIDNGCSSTQAPVALGSGCTNVDPGGGTYAVIPVPDPVNLASASCGAGSINENQATPSFDLNVDACAGGTGRSCNGSGMCLSDGVGDYDQVCYYAAGDVPCPSGLPDRDVYYTGSTDSRDCPSSCNCEPPASAECSMALSIYDGSCTSSGLLDTLVDSCFGPTNFAGSIRVNNLAGGPGTVACSPETTNIAPSGAATPTGPITYCCL